jgi:cellulose synthase/poly-beta-1,6-N-acetylglucosamine synthase-like glycosyltransferase
MRYPTIANYTDVNGAMPMLYAIRDSIPYAFSVALFTIFFVLVASEYFIIKNKSGRGKILTAMLSTSIVMVILSLLLALAQLVTFIDPVFYGLCSIVFFALYKLSSHF